MQDKTSYPYHLSIFKERFCHNPICKRDHNRNLKLGSKFSDPDPTSSKSIFMYLE